MDYSRSDFSGEGRRNNYRENNGGGRNNNYRPREPAPIVARRVPSNYVDLAQDYMKYHKHLITTSKLRSLFSLLSEVYNVENLRTEDQLLESSISKLNLMRVRTAYEYGRDTNWNKNVPQFVQQFIEGAHLLDYLKWFSTPQPGSRRALIDFYHYMEALVAFHRYYGGKENG